MTAHHFQVKLRPWAKHTGFKRIFLVFIEILISERLYLNRYIVLPEDFAAVFDTAETDDFCLLAASKL